MPACKIPLKRLMPGSLSQPRMCYPPAGCGDLLNEFISLVAMARSSPPHGLSVSVWVSAVAQAEMTATLIDGKMASACM